jgi:hypothetical protein
MKLIQNSLRASVLVMATLLLSVAKLSAQTPTIRCHSVYMDSVRHAANPNLQTNDEFEDWIKKEITVKEIQAQSSLIINGVYQIPVIVHVIHEGEAIGVGTNLSAAIIQSQIDVLNEDFRRIIGTNGYNTNPVGADTQIEFCLAQRKPDGSGFTPGEEGINRVNGAVQFGGGPYATGTIDATIKPYNIATQGYDAADYMNLWSVDISGGILGYAQFPTTALGGMGCAAQNVNTDGVVMDYATLGKAAVTGFPGPYNEGRTATHEIGHWLGLRHIWGDGGCGVDDFCNDTPLSDGSNFGCPTTNSCADPAPDPNDMVENYMDYTDDLCMNIFTNDQKMRMRTVLENSPIRASLITSDACIPPALNDASIVNIVNPLGDNCPGSITPIVTLRNRGSLNLTSATIEYTIDGGAATSFAWTGTITPGNEANVSLPAFTTSLGVHTIKAYSLLPNTVVDPDPTYDTTSLQFAVSNGYQPDHLEDFEAGVFPPDVRWLVDNANSDCIEWVGQSGVSNTGTSPNDAACVPFFSNNGSTQEEYLYTPIFILPCNATSAEVKFDHAYRRRVNTSSDRLRLQMSLDCGATWTNTLFDNQGAALSTGANSNSYWIPGVAGDWSANTIDLSAFVTATSQNVQFRFRATNAAGNSGGNVYVDNFEFNAVTPGEIEVSVSTVSVLDEGFYDYGTVGVGATSTATFTIDNPGTSNLVLTGPIVVTGGPEFVLNTTFGTTTVPAGGSTTFLIDFTPATPGVYTGSVTFGTNDCDEGTYNFILNGTTNVDPPVASFTATPTDICQGSTVTYTDASSNATTWTWSFPNGTPNSATGVGPHVITYNTPGGPFNAQLDVTNAYGSDLDLQTGLITVLPGTGVPLPVTEGFVAATFPPTNWSLNNNGNANTWVRDGAEGNAPTAGNSATIDFFTTNTTGDQDDLVLPAADMTGLVSAQLEFDVAYARYNATYQDQLQVVVSNDCGTTWVIEYDKAGAVLATDPDQTPAYTPITWRTETIDLSAYVGSGKVDVIIRGISGWGQHLFVDNVNLTGVVSACDDPDVPTMTYAPATVCDGGDATITITGNLDDATDWYVYTGSCGGTAVGTTNTSTILVTPSGPSTTYFIRGEGGCVVPGACGNINVTVDPIEDATFAYGSADYCGNVTDPTPAISGVGGGTFTSVPAGLSINGSTGAIDVSASTPNTYTVSYTTPGTCAGVSNQVITINATPTAPIIITSGATTFCAGGSVDLTSSQASGNVWSTTETTQTINVTGTGNYSVTYTDGNGCSVTSAATAVTVNALPTAPTISADGPVSLCSGGSVNLTSSQASGNVWSTAETTQTINVTGAGNYSVVYTDGNGCSATSAVTVVTVNSNPAVPTISAGGPTTFCAGGSVNLTSSQASGNVWSTAETTQMINATGTGNYSVTYTDGNGCSATSAVTSVTVNANPATPTISAGGPTTFCAGGSVNLTSSQSSGNIWSTTETTQTINASAAGNYSVTYTNGNGCSATSAITTVAVNALPTAPTISAGGPTTFCAGGSVNLTSSQASGNVWSTTETTQTINVTGTGNYAVTYTDGNGCSATSAVTAVAVNALPTVPTISAGGPTTFCAGGSVNLTSSQASGNVWSTTETAQTINATGTGNYSVTFTDGNGCSSTSAVTVVTENANPAAPTISAGGPTAFCVGGSVNLTSSQASGNVWSTAETTQTINVTGTGNYSVTYTDGNGCSSTSATTAVTVNALPTVPTISAGGPTTFCAGGSVNLTSSQASGNVWSTAETTQTINATGTGNYSVTYTDGNGCSATSAMTAVTVNANPAAPTISAGGPTTFCAGGTVTLTSSQGSGNVWSTASTSNNIIVSTGGPYSVTYTDVNGCSATSGVTNVTVNPAPVIAVGTVLDPNTCATATGSIQITGSGTGVVSWAGSASGTSGSVSLPFTITGLAAGSYNVTFDDGCGSNMLNQTLTDPTPPTAPTITAGGPTTFCAGGSVTLTSSYGTGNTWSTAETTGAINVNATGTYSVTYTDGSGCSSSSAPINVTVNASPAIPTVSPDGPTTFCSGGSVNLSSSQATGNVWSTAATTQVINVTTAGPYSVTYTDGNGCSSTSAATTITVNATPSAPVISASGPLTFCAGGSVDLTSSQASGNVWSTTETTQTINVTGAGNYAVTYTDGNGCSAASTITAVTVNGLPAAPTISASGPTTFCAGGSVDLTSSQASGNVWSTAETTQTINVTGTGNYAVTYTDGNGCSATSAITAVTVNALPTVPVITADGPTTFCEGGSVNLTSSQASGNGWSTIETTQTINATGTGNYSVTYTDGNGCSATSAVTVVTENANPTAPIISADGPTTFCAGGSVNLTSSQASGNVWSTAETTQTINVTGTGSYSVNYTDGNGCSAISAITAVTVDPVAVIAVGTIVDPAACATSTGSIQITGSGTGVVSWTGSATGNTGSVSLPYTITGLGAGSYNVTFDGGCGSNVLNQILSDPTPPTAPTIIAGGPTTFCDGGSVNLTSSYLTGNTWSTTETTGSINVSASGMYSVTYTDGSGCSASSTPISITVNTNPSVPVISAGGPTTFCAGGSVNLTSSQVSGNVWSTAETTQTIIATAAGNYSVTYTDGNGCSATSALTSITVNALPTAPSVIPSGPTTFCSGGSVNLTSSQVSGNVWSTMETTQSVNVTNTGSYTVTYTDGNGCSAVSAPISVTVNASPVAPVVTASGPTTFCAGGAVDLTSSYLTGNTWSTTETTVGINVNTTGLYTVTYTDGNGCSSMSVGTSVVVIANPAPPIITASGTTSLCTGGSVDLTSSLLSGNVWSTTETTQTINITGAGSYTVTYTDGNGCQSISTPTVVTLSSNPVAPIVTASGPISFCVGGSVDLSSDQATGNEWSTTETTQTITVSAAGPYSVTYTDGNGCSSTSPQIDVIVNPLPIVTFGALSDVCDYSAAFSLTGASPAGGSYSGTGVTGGSFDPSVAGVGTHTITYDYTDSNGCAGSAVQDINVGECLDLPEITTADIVVYPNPTLTLVNVYAQGALINTVKMYDGSGRLVAEYNEIAEKVVVDLSQMARGVYHLEIALGDQIYRSRVVKK